MQQYYLIRPAVYGDLGSDAVIDHSARPPLLQKVHIEINVLSSDDLHAVHLCYMVSERLGRRLEGSKLTGAKIEEAQIELSEQAREYYPHVSSLGVLRLKVHGQLKIDDFRLDEHDRLIVSQAAMDVLREFRLEEGKVYDGNNPPSQEQITKDVWDDARRCVE